MMMKWFGIAVVVVIVLVGGYFLFAKSSSAPSTTAPVQTQVQATTVPPDQMKGTSPSGAMEESTITLSSSGFSPATLTVKAGAKVTWKNTSGEAATVNSDPHPTHTDYPPLNLGSFQDGGVLSLTFDKPGTYGYHNHFNPSEKGTIIVK